MHMWGATDARKDHWIPWSYRWLGAAGLVCENCLHWVLSKNFLSMCFLND